jgi:hypothetical protein
MSTVALTIKNSIVAISTEWIFGFGFDERKRPIERLRSSGDRGLILSSMSEVIASLTHHVVLD